nr:Phenylacetaldehyde dehydrogenase [Klebsiella pneumoniae]
MTLELGENAALFLDDLTPEAMVNGIIEAGYLNQGQICAAAERFICRRENWMRYWRC